ncbi:MAG: TolC family protein [Bacteroidetes bacterium]|nr:TolC family protein [Bacteroidota bacterium]
MMKKIITILSFLLNNNFLHAQNVNLTLVQALDSVEKNYPEILKYDSKIQSLRALAEGSKAWMPPTASFGLNQFPYNPMMLKDAVPMNQAGLMFTVEQMIPNSGKLNAKQKYLSSLPQIQKDNKEWAKNTLHLYAKYFYYQRLVAEKKLKLVSENRELLELLIKTSEAKYPYNQSDLSTIFKARAKLEELKNMEAMIHSLVSESNIGLNTLMNRDVNTVFSIDTTVVINSYETFSLVSDINLLYRSDITAMQNSIKSMKLSKDYMYSLRKPDFGVRIDHMQMFGMPNQYSVMGMITIPIAPWSAKMYKSEVKSMGFEIQSMTQEKQTMQLMAIQMINEKLSMLKYDIEQLKNYSDGIIPMYSKNFEAGLLAYKQNTGSFFVLLDSWEMLLMKKMEYNDKLFTVLKLQAEYEYETQKK